MTPDWTWNSKSAAVQREGFIVNPDSLILITGGTGFIGSKVVENLLGRGFRNLRCIVRSSSKEAKVAFLRSLCRGGATLEIVEGNLLSPKDCAASVRGAELIFHLAAGRGEKSFPDAFMNSVVTTRNLLQVCSRETLKRFVNVSSFAVYSNRQKPHGRLLDEACPVEMHPELRGDAYGFAKVQQERIVTEYCDKLGIPYVIIRPGWVYGPGNEAISGRIGIGTFGVFLHLGGFNSIPLSYVDNCADAIVLAGLMPGVDGEIFNAVDDNLPSSRQFLRLYKRNAQRFASIYVPHAVSYVFCYLWERYSTWSQGQLPAVFNRRKWHALWKYTRYSNERLKTKLGWMPQVNTADAMARYFESCRSKGRLA